MSYPLDRILNTESAARTETLRRLRELATVRHYTAHQPGVSQAPPGQAAGGAARSDDAAGKVAQFASPASVKASVQQQDTPPQPEKTLASSSGE